MTEENKGAVPQSPETQSAQVREELDQQDVTHQGHPDQPEKAGEDRQQYMGATENDVTPITPPMQGPGDLVGETSNDDTPIDPQSELTPG